MAGHIRASSTCRVSPCVGCVFVQPVDAARMCRCVEVRIMMGVADHSTAPGSLPAGWVPEGGSSSRGDRPASTQRGRAVGSPDSRRMAAVDRQQRR